MIDSCGTVHTNVDLTIYTRMSATKVHRSLQNQTGYVYQASCLVPADRLHYKLLPVLDSVVHNGL